MSNRLELRHNEALADIAGLAGLTAVKRLVFEGEQPFPGLAPLAALTNVGQLEILASPLVDLDGLTSLPQIGHLLIQSNEQLAGLSGLSNFTTLASLTLDSNPALADLSDLSALATMTGTLDIRGNATLSAVSGAAALTAIGGRLVVVNNPQLACSDVFAWADPIAVALGRKIAGNKDCGPPADPCPWTGDGECDDEDGGLGTCVKDSDTDCCHAMACR